MIIMITIIYYPILKFTLHNNSNAKNVQDVQVLHKGTELAQYAVGTNSKARIQVVKLLYIYFYGIK